MDAVYYAGCAFIAYSLLKLIQALYNVFYPFTVGKLIANKITDIVDLSVANWAVITGATDGIGKAYASFLAKQGFSVVLISRNQDKLDATEAEIKEASPNVDVKTVAFDFSVDDTKAYETTFKALFDSLNIAVLVNNVGVSYQYPEQLHKIPGGMKSIRNNVVINTLPVSLLSYLVLPQMSSRGQGVIINVSSASGDIPTPYLGVYSAAKKYVQFLTRTCMEEYKGQGIIFQCVSPYFVATKMSRMRPSFFCPSADAYVRSAMAALSLQSFTYGCIPHAMQGAVTGLLNEGLVIKTLAHMMKSLRNKNLKKQAKAQ